MKAPSLIVPRKRGEDALKIMYKAKLLNHNLKVASDNRIHIPLSRHLSEEEQEALLKEIPEAFLSEEEFIPRERRPKSFLEILDDKLPPHLLASLPKSMDLIGSVAIVEIPKELEASKRLIGGAILQTHKVHTVLAKAGPVTGETRVRDYEVIAGSEETETTYREFGCVYLLDPMKVYFSPRLSQERIRVAQSVREGETVLDMFAGVGPFSILIAKMRSVSVNSVDINPDAARYLARNILVNKVGEYVIPFLGDVRSVVATCLVGRADRAVMNLPERALGFVSVACQALKPEGGIIHYYSFQRGIDATEQAEQEIRRQVEEAGREIVEVKASRLVRETAPRVWQVAVDAVVH